MFKSLSVVVLMVCSTFTLGAEPKSIDLGGLRQAKATLSISDADYLVKVQMIPVKSFDQATNARLNREKGRELAIQALAKHLSDKESVEFTISGAQIEKVGTDGKLYTLVLRVPRKGVAVVRGGDAQPTPAEKVEKVSFSSSFFTRKQDYLATLNQLRASFLIDLKMVEDKYREEKDEGEWLAIAKIEKKVLTHLETLGKEVANDLLLLTVEQEELAKAVGKSKRTIKEQVKVAKKRYEAKP